MAVGKKRWWQIYHNLLATGNPATTWPAWPSQLALQLEDVVRARAKERQIAAQANDAGRAVRANLPQQEQGRSRDELASMAGVSPRTIDSAKSRRLLTCCLRDKK